MRPTRALLHLVRASRTTPTSWVCRSCARMSVRKSFSHSSSGVPSVDTIKVLESDFPRDEWTNVTPSILKFLSRRLHLQKDHPVLITRQLIESRFPGYRTHNNLPSVVSVQQNFDSLGFPADHVGRSKTDTYYLNKDTVLRTHTSAHQADVFRSNQSDGFLISADVYRRDAIDRSHFPVFHQMEGAFTWDRAKYDDSAQGTLAKRIWADVAKVPQQHNLHVLDPHPPFHHERNPLQAQHHSPEEAEAIGAHLKRSLENVVVEIFTQARKAQQATGQAVSDERLQVRWVEAYFPFTSPSWELEVMWNGDWLEVLGCGVVRQDILINAGVPSRIGWAFGFGLERIAMLLFSIPDIRLFWQQDARFLQQFQSPFPYDAQSTMTQDAPSSFALRPFTSFSKYPAAPRDVAFWLPDDGSAGDERPKVKFHENDLMEIIREVAGSDVEDVRLLDEFTNRKTGRKSLCYRINYRSFERTLVADVVNDMHERIRVELHQRLGVELR